jgi:hypothetical protein
MAEQFTLIPACKSSIARGLICEHLQSSILSTADGVVLFHVDILEQSITDIWRRQLR